VFQFFYPVNIGHFYLKRKNIIRACFFRNFVYFENEPDKFILWSKHDSTITLARTQHAAGRQNRLGPSPVELVLQALGGCTAMDIVSILQKMRRTIRSLTLDLEAERREEYPRIFTQIHLLYTLVSPDVTEHELERAIQLSEEKYCSVSGMLRATVKMTTSYELRQS
jgi:putative redox protein